MLAPKSLGSEFHGLGSTRASRVAVGAPADRVGLLSTPGPTQPTSSHEGTADVMALGIGDCQQWPLGAKVAGVRPA